MGKLPEDMPSARDPAIFRHPRYREVTKRGRTAGMVILCLIIFDIVISVIFTRSG
jgi:hypothetical protein